MLSRSWQLVLVWAGLRGAVSLAAALSLPAALPARDLLVTLTFGVVLFTLVVQGFTTRALLKRLHLTQEDDGESAVQFSLGRLHALDAAIREVGALQRTGALAESIAEPLRRHYTERRGQIHEELESTYQNAPAIREQQSREAMRHLLHVKREAVRDLAARGQISTETLNALVKEIDGELDGLDAMAGRADGRQNPHQQSVSPPAQERVQSNEQ